MKPYLPYLYILILAFLFVMSTSIVTHDTPSTEKRIFQRNGMNSKFIDDFENVAIMRDFLFEKYRNLNNIEYDEDNEFVLKNVKLDYSQYFSVLDDLLDKLEKSTANLSSTQFKYKENSFQLIDYSTLLYHRLEELVKAHNLKYSKFDLKKNDPIPVLY